MAVLAAPHATAYVVQFLGAFVLAAVVFANASAHAGWLLPLVAGATFAAVLALEPPRLPPGFFNPALTLGFALRAKDALPLADAVAYAVAQTAGTLAALALVGQAWA